MLPLPTNAPAPLVGDAVEDVVVDLKVVVVVVDAMDVVVEVDDGEDEVLLGKYCIDAGQLLFLPGALVPPKVPVCTLPVK